MFLLTVLINFVAFVALPDSKDAILAHEKKENIVISTSGSIGLYYGGKCHKTYGNETLVSDEHSDWCSNIVTDKNDPKKNPFIQYSIKDKQIKLTKYTVRNGCCHYYCCCDEENGKVIDYGYCCCSLYSYSLHASNDNITWTVLHKVEKDKNFDFCGAKTFALEKQTIPYKYFRFVLDEEWPDCPKCMQVNELELYGETVSSGYLSSDNTDDEESISIIGRVKKSE